MLSSTQREDTNLLMWISNFKHVWPYPKLNQPNQPIRGRVERVMTSTSWLGLQYRLYMFASWLIFCYFGCCTWCCTMTMGLKSFCFKTWGKFRKMDTSPSLLGLLKGHFIQISYSLWSLTDSFGFTVQVLSLLTSLVVLGNDIKTIQQQHVFF